MDTNTRRAVHPAAVAVLVLLPPPVLAGMLRMLGPEHITLRTNPGLVPLYWVPSVLMLAGGAAALAGGSVRRARRRPGHRGLWAAGAAALLMVVPLLLFAFVCVYGASASTLDGGWLPENH
ncbi:hypothetical protein [Actinomadura sp. WAC 06369]|uniref:hypothetical protein n=1 Tax=Actinomadura sp. WAC 06369 TaxID=2203193 RepID=UPI000F7B1F48|nr:hypothetical protein [Actinomadura sp. WAC 06369]RSN40407.1 hypothetical protein DMH08_39525 [Actinomadura sp. WAC 06369]